MSDIGNVGQGKYYSGHYCCFGLNVIAVCGAYCRCIYLFVGCPGSVSDSTAFSESVLSQLVEQLPSGIHLIGDNAFVPTEHMLVPYSGHEKNYTHYNVYNFFLSQLRIKVERLFGFVTTKWRIFRRPLQASMRRNILVIEAAFRLTNYCINERLLQNDLDRLIDADVVGLSNADVIRLELATTVAIDHELGYLPSDAVSSLPGQSILREIIAGKIARDGLVRPLRNLKRKERMESLQ